MKRLIIFEEDRTARKYGIGTYINSLCELRDHYEIIIVTLFCLSREVNYTLDNKVKYLKIPKNVHSRNFSTVKYLENVMLLIDKYLLLKANDIYHFNYFNEHSLISSIIKRVMPKKIVFTVHYLPWISDKMSEVDKIKLLLTSSDLKCDSASQEEKTLYYMINLVRKSLELSTDIICLNHETYNCLAALALPQIKFHLIYNGVPEYKQSFTKDLLREKYGFNADDLIFIYVGRIEEMKGCVALVKAIELMLNEPYHKRIRLLIVGDGDYNILFETDTRCMSSIVLTGRVSKAVVNELYLISDVGCLLSFSEQCSFTLLEMMMHKLPIISTNIQCITDFISCDFDKIAINCDNNDVSIHEVALAMQYLINNERCRSLIGQSNFRRYKHMFTEIKMLQKLNIVYGYDD